ncbi:hypothetical protein SAMN02910456_01908 [Ruminococcaceae bacterium YRB3002]|nr:hypothetical protein SAMN02910456_01908 [Ruminococcaceae bacterium YRB3002]
MEEQPNKEPNKVIDYISKCFLPPKRLNWGYPVFLMAVGMLVTYLLRLTIFEFDPPFSPTSLAFNALIVPFMTLVALIIPAIALASSDPHLDGDKITGEYKGVGANMIALLSGIPLSLIVTSLHNMSTWLWLRLGRSMIYPAFMSYIDDAGLFDKMLDITTQSVIPALGIAVFFTGIMWSAFKEDQGFIRTVIIILFLVAYSLNFIDIPGTIVTGIWICFLRQRTKSAFAPFLAMSAMKITEILFSGTLTRVDITTLQTYSDIPVSVFYASVPAIFIGLILFAFFKQSLDDFEYTYNSDLLGREAEERSAEEIVNDPVFMRGFNPALLIGLVILAALWVVTVT